MIRSLGFMGSCISFGSTSACGARTQKDTPMREDDALWLCCAPVGLLDIQEIWAARASCCCVLFANGQSIVLGRWRTSWSGCGCVLTLALEPMGDDFGLRARRSGPLLLLFCCRQRRAFVCHVCFIPRPSCEESERVRDTDRERVNIATHGIFHGGRGHRSQDRRSPVFAGPPNRLGAAGRPWGEDQVLYPRGASRRWWPRVRPPGQPRCQGVEVSDRLARHLQALHGPRCDERQ